MVKTATRPSRPTMDIQSLANWPITWPTDFLFRVYIKHPKCKIAIEAEVISVKYDAVIGRYTAIEFGNFKKEIKNLTKSYRNSTVNAVEDLSIELKPGEIYGFLGPNGAGAFFI